MFNKNIAQCYILFSIRKHQFPTDVEQDINVAKDRPYDIKQSPSSQPLPYLICGRKKRVGYRRIVNIISVESFLKVGGTEVNVIDQCPG